MGFMKDITKGISKGLKSANASINQGISNSKERDKGKAIYASGKELPLKPSELVKEGYYIAMKREQDKTAELEKIKQETNKLKLEKERDLAKLEKIKVKEQIKKIEGDGW